MVRNEPVVARLGLHQEGQVVLVDAVYVMTNFRQRGTRRSVGDDGIRGSIGIIAHPLVVVVVLPHGHGRGRRRGRRRRHCHDVLNPRPIPGTLHPPPGLHHLLVPVPKFGVPPLVDLVVDIAVLGRGGPASPDVRDDSPSMARDTRLRRRNSRFSRRRRRW